MGGWVRPSDGDRGWQGSNYPVCNGVAKGNLEAKEGLGQDKDKACCQVYAAAYYGQVGCLEGSVNHYFSSWSLFMFTPLNSQCTSTYL